MSKMKTQIASLSIVFLIGFGYYFLSDIRESTHYCQDKKIVVHCESLSSSNITCYTLPLNQGGKRCLSSWISIGGFLTLDYKGSQWYCEGRGIYSICSDKDGKKSYYSELK